MHTIDLKTKIPVDGHGIKLHMLGRAERGPAVLFVHGGPGIPNRQAVISKLGDRWTDFCTLVPYDQRGTGGSYRGTDARDLTVARMVADLDGVVEFVRTTLGVPKVVLLCGSWGTVIGIRYIQRHPEKVAAYIGSGQMVNGVEGERLSYQYALDKATAANDTASLAVLREVGPPVNGCYRPVRKGLRKQRQILSKYGGSTVRHTTGLVSGTLKQLLSSEMSLADKRGALLGYRLSIDTLWPAMIDFDFNRDAVSLDVPVYILQGRHDFTTPSPLIAPWFDRITAPEKALIWFEQSAHGPLGEETAKYTAAVREILEKNG